MHLVDNPLACNDRVECAVVRGCPQLVSPGRHAAVHLVKYAACFLLPLTPSIDFYKRTRGFLPKLQSSKLP